ncbi:hypothetical protein DDB_G0276321 [Dictyostelium discoideum AX4]|uniref:medium-chain acyl-CoA ligase n=1 Tax=Dictyostelium discoideum TaxID=44689 RepID=Q551W4_DICDI|nr:hypothetical protein DDB_G0276321 [Dictyostelium discoideum AX4]EAL69307.1 hypothetical protein DDB_G0276321 [Dictyostelium discoideum AX4]|eukprot:XP_643213.1 hypothetical protein DDB_G0276321 [Dictyostelium discoideum AX4]
MSFPQKLNRLFFNSGVIIQTPKQKQLILNSIKLKTNSSCSSKTLLINNNKNNNNNNIYNKRFYSSTTPYEFLDRNLNKVQNLKNYEEAYKSFKWDIPEYFNIGQEICDKHANDPNKMNHIAIKHIIDEDKNISKEYTFKDLQTKSNQLANKYKEIGLKKRDRVGVLLSQGFECALSHTTTLRSGMITMPLFTLFGPEALEFRLSNSSTSCVLTDLENLEKLLGILPCLPNLKKIIVFGTLSENFKNNSHYGNLIEEWNDKISENYSKEFEAIKSKSDDEAVIIFTSGTTGNPKGCLHAHRVLLGHLPGVQFPQNNFPNRKSTNDYIFYTPADWAWIGGLFDVLIPSLYYGVTVLAHRMTKFEPKKICKLLIDNKVDTAFLPPSALKIMKQQEEQLKLTPVNMTSIGSGGESLGEKLLQWGKEQFNVEIAEFYGQTEANLLVGNCPSVFPIKNGSIGKPIPGHIVEIIDSNGMILPIDQVGDIALKTPDPVAFLTYWNNDKAAKKKMNGDWLVTGDLGRKDSDGYIWYVGRDDDIINSSGYRIGPSEIENCLLKHPSVSNVGVVGVPDEIRGEIVKAFIVLNPSYSKSDQLKKDIQNYVKTILSAHEYPREIEFINELPTTTTGKIIRKDLRSLHNKK